MTDQAYDEALARAVKLTSEGQPQEALEILRGLARQPLTVRIAIALGDALANTGENEESERWLNLAARNRPADPNIRVKLARTLLAQQKIDAAELEYRTALAFKPDDLYAQVALGGMLLSVGRFEEGWKLFEARTPLNPDLIPPINVAFPEWTGEPLAGKSILVWYEQGFGDQIQMSRFAQELKARGAAHVALGARPPLTHLFTTLGAVDEVIAAPRGESVSIRRYDYWSRYFSLPHRLGTRVQDLPRPAYLSAPADRRQKWRGYSGVGYAWRASPTGFNGRNKSLPAEQAERLKALGAVSLDPEDTGVADFADTAAIIEQLDLVISIDSSVAHLAGAMGKPVWTLLPFINTDWRWMFGRADSPWYPTMRLFRQASPGPQGWAALVDQVVEALERRPAA